MTLKVGVVGMGNIGNVHAQVYKENPKVELVAACDIIKERADRAAERYGAQAFYSVKEMLASGIHLDACSVTTAGKENGGDHFIPTMELLEAGIPVLGEKPISNSIEEAKQMVALAMKKKIPYAINLNHRFTPAARKAKQWVEEEKLGSINMINMRLWINNPNESSPWFHLRALHPHSFDVMRYFCGDVKRVAAFMKKGEGRAIWSNTQVLLEFNNGIIGTLTGSYDAGDPYGLERCEVVGSKGRFVLEDACEHLHFYNRFSIESKTYNYLGGMRSFNETFKDRIGVWIDQLCAGVSYDKIDGSGLDGLKAQLIIESAIKSWDTESIVEVEEVKF
ncbi:MAG TPA: Gfo/Idh/MocA family oxidoreductase [Candidatus Atribacteria bacterium]|nr:Gfo/Idh/MocA family oxidoreductase [Candidatus Atribacteria bacterium]